jgi:hypothetical protein
MTLTRQSGDMAAGTANVMTPGSQAAECRTIVELKKQVIVL